MARWWKWLICAAGLLVGGCDRGEVAAPAGSGLEAPVFWVWHRSSSLTERELGDLERAGVGFLYWQVAELGWENDGWQVARVAGPQVLEVAGVAVFPVIRIKPDPGFLNERRAAGDLAAWFRQWSGDAPLVGEVQLDFDCPGRLLGRYARFLTELRNELGGVRVSATALASWVAQPDFAKLAAAASSLSPMFYDLEGDLPVEVLAGRFRPMVDGEALAWVGRWRKCQTPWRAGLPNFERVSVFAAEGELRGHVRGWVHDELVFNDGLTVESQGRGTTRLRVERAVEIGGTRISPGEIVVHRMPEEKGLREMAETARQAGARSVMYFSLPGPGLQASYSASHLAADQGKVRLEVEWQPTGELSLRNVGPVDLPVRLAGWELVLQSGAMGAFRSAGPGGFGGIAVEGGLPAEAVGELRLRFAKLAAGERIASGAVVAGPEGVRWRVEEAGQEWRPLNLLSFPARPGSR